MASKASDSRAKELRGVLVETARVQLITVGAAVKFWARWAESAERYTKALDQELGKVTAGVSSRDAVARLSDVSRSYLREVADLPRETLEQFTRDLEKVSQPRPQAKRTRSARAKD
jgi:hypothetical protein